MLKFEGKFQKGDIIRAYDFEPRAGVEDSYIIGEVIDVDNAEHGFKAYKVLQYRHVVDGQYDASEAGTEAWIPYQVGFCEFDERITLIAGENAMERGLADPAQDRKFVVGDKV